MEQHELHSKVFSPLATKAIQFDVEKLTIIYSDI